MEEKLDKLKKDMAREIDILSSCIDENHRDILSLESRMERVTVILEGLVATLTGLVANQ